MLSVLVTGFEPFGGDAINSSLEAVKALAKAWDALTGAILHTAQLPVTFAGAAPALMRAIAETKPDAVIAVGYAAGSSEIRLERVAVNVIDARIPDNAGSQPVDEAVEPDGPTAYFSTLPIKRALARLGERKIPAIVSNSAGTYVCNAVFYALQHALAGTATCSGFVHVPALGELAAPRSDVDAAREQRPLAGSAEGKEVVAGSEATDDADALAEALKEIIEALLL